MYRVNVKFTDGSESSLSHVVDERFDGPWYILTDKDGDLSVLSAYTIFAITIQEEVE